VNTAVIVVDLGFGDSGKGTLTDYWVGRLQAQWVVRFNGGAQAGHTVVCRDGRSHIFSQFGAGSWRGARTYLSPHFLLHPGGLLAESERCGVPLNKLAIDPQVLLITPFQQACNRLRELLRGAERHGSCGLGIGEAMQDAIEWPDLAIRAVDLADAGLLKRKLLALQQLKYEQFRPQLNHLRTLGEAARAEVAVLESASLGAAWARMCEPLLSQVFRPKLEGPIVLEGAQGVLLDEWRGFHPHTTWSRCTFNNALEVLRDWDGPVYKLGVLRSYLTRHGAGPFPSEEPTLQLPEPHNHLGPWQGAFRQGWQDLVLLRYALACCEGVDGLAVTHMDRCHSDWRVVEEHPEGELPLGPWMDLEYQQGLTRRLLASRPQSRPIRPQELVAYLEGQLERPIWITSHGPCAEDKVALPACPQIQNCN
jgi:adenylosuccinate synthase